MQADEKLILQSQRKLEKSIFDQKRKAYESHSSLSKSDEVSESESEILTLRQKLKEAEDKIKKFEVDSKNISNPAVSAKKKLTFTESRCSIIRQLFIYFNNIWAYEMKNICLIHPKVSFLY